MSAPKQGKSVGRPKLVTFSSASLPQVKNSGGQSEELMFYNNFDLSNYGRERSCVTKNKNRRRRWTQKDMTNAYNAVKYRSFSLRSAASLFNVPESTLRDRIHGRVSLECSRPGPPTFFTYEEEKRMVDHILFMSKIGYPYTRNQVVELAGDLTKAVDRIAPFKYLNPSQAWFYAFLNRWPDLKNFLYGPRSTNRRSKGVSGDAMHAYFEQLDKVITKFGVKDEPDSFWMFDELCVTCENQPPRILPISVQRAQSITYWTPTVSMISGGSAGGDKLPPFLVFKGDKVTEEMMTGSVKGTKFCTSPQGWISSDVFLMWFIKHFRTYVHRRPVVLLYDGHLQYVTVRVLERAKHEGIIFFPLPPHPAYNHCVENTCIWAFARFFKKRCDRFIHLNPGVPLTKNNISAVLCHSNECALRANNLIHLFCKLGICPFNNMAREFGAYYRQELSTNEEGAETSQGSVPFQGDAFNSSTMSQATKVADSSPAYSMSTTPTKGNVDASLGPCTASELLFAKRSREKESIPECVEGMVSEDQWASIDDNMGEYDPMASAELICAFCEKNEPPNSADDKESSVSWIQCNYCGHCFHIGSCCDPESGTQADSTFMCHSCQQQTIQSC